eukprot:scaffold75205_cov97-Phaeocystis_antarctica.AAC.1
MALILEAAPRATYTRGWVAQVHAAVDSGQIHEEFRVGHVNTALVLLRRAQSGDGWLQQSIERCHWPYVHPLDLDSVLSPGNDGVGREARVIVPNCPLLPEAHEVRSLVTRPRQPEVAEKRIFEGQRVV